MSEESEKNRFGHLRCRATRKPTVQCPPVHFYYCSACGALLSNLTELSQTPVCCDREMEVLEAKTSNEIPESELTLSYLICGSVNENAIKAYWECKDSEEELIWIWLRTFTGGQLKYASGKTKSPFIFGLAQEDAYAYCDKDPCVECTFRCKRGFGLYYYFSKRGLIYLPLERMTARQQSIEQTGGQE